MKINGEKKFSVCSNYFAISAVDVDYTLQFSVDGENWTAVDGVTPAGENHIISGCPRNLYWRMKDNTGDALIQW